MMKHIRPLLWPVEALMDGLFFVPLLFLCLVARFKGKKLDVGIGPEPIVSHEYQKKALQNYGYTAETYVNSVYFITQEFDIRADLYVPKIGRKIFSKLLSYFLFTFVIFRYRCIYIYFNGGPLFQNRLLWRIEPLLYKAAKVKVVVMPYGGDVQEISRSRNLMYKSAISKDYPDFKLKRKRIEKRIDLWTRHASHIISGCDWVEYMYHWDTLVLAHFTIDVNEWKPRNEIVGPSSDPCSLRIFHAPNHKHIKGTRYFQAAVDQLKREGVKIELVVAEKLPHEKIKEMIVRSDIVADQLIIGWYGMFAVEAMAMGKPVLCYIRPDFEELFINEGLIRPGELPIIKCSTFNLAETLRGVVGDQEGLNEIGQRSRQFVIKHHSTTSIGKIFDRINQSIGIRPSGQK